jgi:hypothetical protein
MTVLKAFVAAVLIGTTSASYAAADEPAAFQAQYPDRDVLNGGALTPEGRLKRGLPSNAGDAGASFGAQRYPLYSPGAGPGTSTGYSGHRRRSR